MGAIANLVLTNSTAANKTFTPLSVAAGTLDTWQDASSGIRIGFPVASLGARPPSKSARTSKVTLKLVIPVLEQPSPSGGTGFQPAPTVAYNNLVTIDIICHERSTLLERQDLLAMARDFFGEAVVTAAVETFDLPT